jgi:molybdopterin synthase catalytic subunit
MSKGWRQRDKRPAAAITVRIQAEDFDIAAEIAAPHRRTGGYRRGGHFTGLCRDEGGRLSSLELEHYPGMAERAIRAIALRRPSGFALTGITAIHRFGKIAPGGNIVLVVATAPHRQAAFDGASFLMDYPQDRGAVLEKGTSQRRWCR